jgi:hypothetical protein
MASTLDTLRTADWERLERDVVQRIRALQAVVMQPNDQVADDGTPIMEEIAKDLIMPALGQLATFCAIVEIQDGEEPPCNN